MTLRDLHQTASLWKETPPMPVLFIGHGTPMNALERNEFTARWETLGRTFPRPHAIVCISAHWETRGTFVTGVEKPKTIHDFYGFPDELYRQQYPADGAPVLAEKVITSVRDVKIAHDYEWGLDHGTWSVLKYLYPLADVPVIQLSIDHFKNLQWHYDLAKELVFLRRKGVLIIGSGNMVHNLRMMRLKGDDFNAEYGFDWALEINRLQAEKIVANEADALIDYHRFHHEIRYAIPSLEHYVPMLYTLGVREKDDPITLFNDKVIAGSLSMTSFIIGKAE